MPKLKLLITMLLFSGYAYAAQSGCAGVYYQNQAPDIVDPKLGKGVKEVCYREYGLVHSPISRSALWSAKRLDGAKISIKVKRANDFHPEAKIPLGERAELSDYARSGYDRGHLAPARDFSTPAGERESYSLANMVPQVHEHNVQWADVESAVRDIAKSKGEAYVVTGPIYKGAKLKRIGSVLVPTHIFKAVYTPSDGNAFAVVSENRAPLSYKVVSIANLESFSGISPFPFLKKSKAYLSPYVPDQFGSHSTAGSPMASAPAGQKKPLCSTISTCSEAIALLKGGARHLDGDGDGIPCEKICNH